MCYCGQLKPFASDPEFVILIHPKETRKAINTGRMAFLSLENAKLLVGNDFSQDEALNRLLKDSSKRCYLLFPGAEALDISDVPRLDSERAADKSDVFIILDATWSMAKKMFRLSSNLQKIPQVMFKPEKASEFVIRQQPGFDCYSTIETIHHIIELRTGRSVANDTDPHHHLLRIFRDMVQRQMDYENGTLVSISHSPHAIGQ